jgi:mannose-6-phosphate isomerase
MLTPLSFSPIYKDKVWGGRTLATALGRNLPVDRKVGESWELTGYGKECSVVAEGPLAGTPLDRLVAEQGKALLGSKATGNVFPLLYKFIDAADRLSVQVHPTDEQAIAHGWDRAGKTECWYIAAAKPGAEIIVGFRPGVSLPAVEQAVTAGALEPLLNRFPIAVGDVLFIPAGTVHAIMEGTLIYEVQETSDITLRLYDWNRMGDDGKPRQLHVKESLQVLRTEAHNQHRMAPLSVERGKGVERRLRAACRYFALEDVMFADKGRMKLPKRGSFQVMTVVAGGVELECGGKKYQYGIGATVLLPAEIGQVTLSGTKGAKVLVSWVPDIRTEIVGPCRKAGLRDEEIGALGGYAALNDVLTVLK